MKQHFGQRLAAGGGVGHGVEFFVALAVIGLSGAGLAGVVGEELFVLEILGELFEAVEILGLVGFFLHQQGPLGLGALVAALYVLIEHLHRAAIFGVGFGKLKHGIILKFL